MHYKCIVYVHVCISKFELHKYMYSSVIIIQTVTSVNTEMLSSYIARNEGAIKRITEVLTPKAYNQKQQCLYCCEIMLYINHGKEVYMANILPKIEGYI